MEEYTEEVKAELKGLNKVLSFGSLRLYECPLTYITAETREMMRVCWLIEDSKALLFEGGWADQPYWLIEAVEITKAETVRDLRDRKNGK